MLQPSISPASLLALGSPPLGLSFPSVCGGNYYFYPLFLTEFLEHSRDMIASNNCENSSKSYKH